MAGKTTKKFMRFYMDGYDLSGDALDVGPLEWMHDTEPLAALSDTVKGVLPGQVNLGIGALNGFFNNTATTGLHIVASGAGVSRDVMIPIGALAAPAQGDPAYVGQFTQMSYEAVQGDVMTTVTANFGPPHTTSSLPAENYIVPWLLPLSDSRDVR